MDTLTITEVAKELGIHRNTVWQYIHRGLLPAVKYGENTSPLRIKREDLEKFANGRK